MRTRPLSLAALVVLAALGAAAQPPPSPLGPVSPTTGLVLRDEVVHALINESSGDRIHDGVQRLSLLARDTQAGYAEAAEWMMAAAQAAGSFETYHRAMFQAAWRDDQNIGDKNVVLDLVKGLGLELDIEQPALKEKLKQDTAAAEALGLFGVPTFVVGDELFWGHDRMDYVQRAVQGRQRT